MIYLKIEILFKIANKWSEILTCEGLHHHQMHRQGCHNLNFRQYKLEQNLSSFIIITIQIFLMNFMIEIEYNQGIITNCLSVQNQHNGNTENTIPKQVKKKTQKLQIRLRKKKYHWQPLQHKKYCNFLVERKDLFELPLQRKITAGIHTIMSKYIKTRNARQCRSHHQKMMIKYENVENIILYHWDILNLNNRLVINKLEEQVTKTKTQCEKDEISYNKLQLDDLFPELGSNVYFQGQMEQIQSYQYDEDLLYDLD